MASPISVDVKFDANKAMDTVGAWVAALIARIGAFTDAKAKQVIPKLALRLARQAGLNTSFADQLMEQSFDPGRSEAKMRELQSGMKEIVELLNSIDPQFGGAHTDLVAALTASINFKDQFLWKARKGNLFNDAFRKTVAKGMRSQAEKLKEAANALSSAAGLRIATSGG